MKNVFREILDAVGLSLVVFILIQTSMQNFKVEGASMSPTLNSGQYLIVNKLAYVNVDLVRLSKLIPIWRAKQVKDNHNKVVDFINNEVNKCGNADESKKTIWGDPCNGEWIAEKVVSYINNNLEIKNPFSDDSKVKTDPDPRIKAEGKAGQSVEMGVIFLMSSLINLVLGKLYSKV